MTSKSVVKSLVPISTFMGLGLVTILSSGCGRGSDAPSTAPSQSATVNVSSETQKKAESTSVAGFPSLPAANGNPNPTAPGYQFPGVGSKKVGGLSELIGGTPKLEEAIEELLKSNSSEFFSRLTGPSEPPAPDGKDSIFGTACMAHSCEDSAALYIRENGAVAIAYLDTNKNQLVYATNIPQKDGLPDPIRKFAASAMAANPGLVLVGIETTNGITKVPMPVQVKSPNPATTSTTAPVQASKELQAASVTGQWTCKASGTEGSIQTFFLFNGRQFSYSRGRSLSLISLNYQANGARAEGTFTELSRNGKAVDALIPYKLSFSSVAPDKLSFELKIVDPKGDLLLNNDCTPLVSQTGSNSSSSNSSSGDRAAAYGNNIANQLEMASHPACQALASNIRTFANSGAPDYVRIRQIDAILDKAPGICLR